MRSSSSVVQPGMRPFWPQSAALSPLWSDQNANPTGILSRRAAFSLGERLFDLTLLRNSKMTVVTRFAPSPSGNLHVGGRSHGLVLLGVRPRP